MKLILQITKGIVHDQPMRRQAMFLLVLAACVMVFLGATFLGGWLTTKPLVFLLYWAACAWLTLAAMLIAAFDMLAVRAALQREREQLKQKIFHEHEEGR